MANNDRLTLGLARLNPTVGAVAANAELLRAVRRNTRADIIVAGELFLCGYPPEDLVLKRAFVSHIAETIAALAADTADGGPALIFGAPTTDNGKLHNSVIVAADGQCTTRHKTHLPNYAVFDEKRLFAPGPPPQPVEVRGVRLGLPICEDMWFADICAHLKTQGAELFVSPNGSPFERGKQQFRRAHARARVGETGLPLAYINQFGGQDELVFDGDCFVMDARGVLAVQSPLWEGGITLTEWQKRGAAWQPTPQEIPPLAIETEQIYQALVLGLRDYVGKNRFPGVLLGLSGGIDSALCAAIATDALGAKRVQCIMLPSRYTSQASRDDAAACAQALGVRLDNIPITEPVAAMETALQKIFANTQADTTEENIQSRLRGALLMAVSNKFGNMLVTTGNKSEVSVGYATLYGDMNGGYNPIKDIYKTEVFRLAAWRNENLPQGAHGPRGEIIPQAIIDKPPSAELRPDQKDADTLPPYDELDAILFALVEEEASVGDIIAQGFSPDTVAHIENLLYISEYKRRQAAPGTKIGNRNFGRDRRYPITNGFRDARLQKDKI